MDESPNSAAAGAPRPSPTQIKEISASRSSALALAILLRSTDVVGPSVSIISTLVPWLCPFCRKNAAAVWTAVAENVDFLLCTMLLVRLASKPSSEAPKNRGVRTLVTVE